MPHRNNAVGTAIPSGSHNTSQSVDLINEDGKYVDVLFDVEVVGTGSLTLTIQGRGRDQRSTPTAAVVGDRAYPYYTVLAGAAVSGAGPNIYRVGPGLTASNNLVANFILPTFWNIQVVSSDGSAWTYSVTYQIAG